ncbi:MAG: hypothetical protein H8E80_07480 [Desulfobacteraceae bacterium]|uniref:Uncharacterized protein n=1 Tax=Candidatus Desulfaltia bathyphila TaxID=2841697 RepID=A0A8J6N5S5_9BACT|nr:hypothetical protein [Candidatus Desulfaltia bathyphila]MBL7194878.1 hypothetical protein [Desulfobacterales bacterium]
MKLFAQHGYGPGDKIINGFKDNTIDGVIFSARYEKMEKIPGDAKDINSVSSNAEILLDPEFYACFYTHQPDAKLGGLNEWPYFSTQRRSQLESSEIVEKVLADTFDTVVDLPLTSIIAPNIFIPRSFNSIEAVIAKNFIRKTQQLFEKTGDKRKVFATLAIDRTTLIDQTEFEAFLNDITALDNPPDGFYIIVGGGITGDRTEISRSELIHADVIAGWMMLNFTLSINGFKVINGFSDILTPFLGCAGGYAGATGWWSNLRMFSMSRYINTVSGGRLPTIRYLSDALLNRITHSERKAFVKLIPEINNGLPRDSDYERGEPDRKVEVLQSWEAISHLNNENIVSDMDESLKLLENMVNRAEITYTNLAGYGLPVNREANREYMEALMESIQAFRRNAEI